MECKRSIYSHCCGRLLKQALALCVPLFAAFCLYGNLFYNTETVITTLYIGPIDNFRTYINSGNRDDAFYYQNYMFIAICEHRTCNSLHFPLC